MAWGDPVSFPRAIIHVDGDSFFASCEVAKNPRLRGRVVVTGKERGIVSACTYEGKARGITRGMRLFEVLQLCPDAVILPSDYETYSLFSERMYAIVERYTPSVEKYSIDECFADITGQRRTQRASYPEIAARIKRDLDQELGMTFSIGLSATKTLAKIASKWQKPSGLTVLPLRDAESFLLKTPVGSVWGIGANTASLLSAHRVHSALDFTHCSEAWVRAHVSKPFFETWQELRGEVVYELDASGRSSYQSISKTRTFTPPSRDVAYIAAQLSKNIENACIKARRWKLSTEKVVFFLKTQDFRYHRCEVRLPRRTALPQEILSEVRKHFPNVFKKGVLYRATGVTLCDLAADVVVQTDLFGTLKKSEALVSVYERVDAVAQKYGKHSVFLGSSLGAVVHTLHKGSRAEVVRRTETLFKGETKRRRLSLPMLGDVG